MKGGPCILPAKNEEMVLFSSILSNTFFVKDVFVALHFCSK